MTTGISAKSCAEIRWDMKKVIQLVHIQIAAVLTDMLAIGNSRSKKSKAAGYGGLSIFIILMSFVSFVYCMMIAGGLKMFGSLELLPPLMMAVTSLVSLMTTVFKVKGTIFGFRDYDLVMSLPVSTRGIVASRVILLYAVNLVFAAIIMIPAMLVYGVMACPGILFFINSIVSLFFIPLVPIILASILGMVIAYAASRFRHTNLLNILFSVLIIIGIMVFSLGMGDSGQELVDFSRTMTRKVNTMYPLAGLYTNAVIQSDMVSLLGFIGISLLAFVLYSLLVGKCFKWMNSKMLTGASRTKFVMGDLKAQSPFHALYDKELKRFFATPVYVLNTGFGVILLTIGAIVLIFLKSPLAGLFHLKFDMEMLASPQLGSVFGGYGPLMVSFFICMSSTTMASISLEGKNLWILKSLPVSAKTIFHAKMAVNLTILAPVMLDIILISMVLQIPFRQGIILLLTAVVCSVFVSVFGLLINLRFPNFNWTSETIAVKQSAASMVCVFSGMGIVAVQFLLLFLGPNMTLTYLALIGIMGIADIILYRILLSYGTKRFCEL
ncbi:MAG TPA: hypothetical protein DEG06_10575 [Lachnospiraceae bacterium]|jgi:ABC-2 type transport system permease protein|nr:hypothetical protein [Lachnospiraceae bacterium]HCM13042.1 hypothetical protein [Lachnospiraceae bacterium]HCR40280.1 hypothetical protein [Lachnospiraceae bacterium]